MADLKITELASKNISLSDFMIKADSNGLMTKNTVENLSNVLNTVGEVGFKGSVASTDATVGSDGWYFAEDSGTYTNNGGLVIDLSNNLAIIIVSNTQTTFSKIDIPLNITFDATPTELSTNAVTSGGVYTQYEYSSIMDISNATGNAMIDFDSVTNIFTIPSGTVLFKDQGDDVIFSTLQSLDCVANSPEQLVKILFNTLTLAFRVRDYNFVSLEEERVFAYVRKGSSPTVTINCEHSINGVRSYFPTVDSTPTSGSINAVTSGGVYDALKPIINNTTQLFKDDVVDANILALVKGAELYNVTDLSKDYYISSLVTKFPANDNYTILVKESVGNTVVCTFTENNYIKPIGEVALDLTEQNSSGITGKILVNWNDVPDGIEVYNLNEILSSSIYLNKGLSKLESDLIDSNKTELEALIAENTTLAIIAL